MTESEYTARVDAWCRRGLLTVCWHALKGVTFWSDGWYVPKRQSS